MERSAIRHSHPGLQPGLQELDNRDDHREPCRNARSGNQHLPPLLLRASQPEVEQQLHSARRQQREHLEDAQWPEQVLEEAGRTLGAWAARPLTHSAHRWTWARNGRDSELTGPLLLSAPEGALLGVCGDRFAPGGGVEAAFTSGRALAARILTTTKGKS